MFSSVPVFVPIDVYAPPDQPIESRSESDDQSELSSFGNILTNGDAVCDVTAAIDHCSAVANQQTAS